jgi:hypothetical protein
VPRVLQTTTSERFSAALALWPYGHDLPTTVVFEPVRPLGARRIRLGREFLGEHVECEAVRDQRGGVRLLAKTLSDIPKDLCGRALTDQRIRHPPPP